MSPASQNVPMHTPPHVRVLDAYLRHMQAEVSPRTYESYARILRRAQEQLPHGVVEATDDEIRDWLWDRALASQTRRCYIAAIRGLHQWMCRRGISDFDPTEYLPHVAAPDYLPRPVPDDQVAHLLAHARGRVRLWCVIALYAGARCCEIARMQRQHISPEQVRIHGKGDRHRVVPTHPELWAAVRDLPAGAVTDRPAKQISWAIAWEADQLAEHSRWPELAEITAHRLRHTIATKMLEATGDFSVVQQFLGHRSPATTAVYARVAAPRLRAAVEAVPTWAIAQSADAGRVA